MLWHFPSKTQMWHGQQQEHRSGRNIMFAVVPILLSASVHILGDGFMRWLFYQEAVGAGETFAWVKGKYVLFHQGTEWADDKPGFPPLCTSVQGDSWGLSQASVCKGKWRCDESICDFRLLLWGLWANLLSRDVLVKTHNHAYEVLVVYLHPAGHPRSTES